MVLAVFSVISPAGRLSRNGFIERLLAFPMPEGAAAAGGEFPKALGYCVTGAVFCSIAFSWLLYGREDFSLAEAFKKRLSALFNVLVPRNACVLYTLS